MIERLCMDEEYSSLEASIHMARYNLTKQYCKGKTVLDVASGEGYGSYIISQSGAKKVVGVDISDETIKKAKKFFKNDNLEFQQADATDLSCFDDNYFDMVVSFETFEHVSDTIKFLKEIKRVSTKDAIIIISCPNDYYYYPTKEEHNPFHVRKFTFEEFKNIVEKQLGHNAQYCFGSQINGFGNCPLEEDMKLTQMDMVNTSEKIDCEKIYSSSGLKLDNCNYFVAIFNVDKIDYNYVMYNNPSIVLESLKNEVVKLSKYCNDVEEKIKNDENKIIELNKTHDENILELNMISEQLKEKNCYLTEEIENQSKLLNDTKNELYKYKLLYNIEHAKCEELSKANMQVNNELYKILSSRSYRLTRKIVKMVKK